MEDLDINYSDDTTIDLKNSFSRSYKHCVLELNKGKETTLTTILFEYRRVAEKLMYKQLNHWIKNEATLDLSGGKFYNQVSTWLSVSFKDVIYRQTNGILKSHLSNLENYFVRIVNRSNISDDIKKDLFKINRMNDWFDRDKKDSTSKLARIIFKRCLKVVRFPKFNNLNMKLNYKVARIEKSKTCKNDYVIRLTTSNRNYIYIPVKNNTYFTQTIKNLSRKEILHKLNKGMEFIFDHLSNKLIDIGFSITRNKYKEVQETSGQTIALDFGLNNLFTTNKGDFYSKDFKKVLLRYDKKIQTLTENLRKIDKNYTLTSNIRFNKLIKSRRDYIDNEICRVLNRIVKIYKPSKLVLEKLNFQNSDMSTKMNRLISNCGRDTLQTKLNSLKEELGIIIEYVNPAYTSQECSVCHHTEKANRKTQEVFKCLSCKHKENADFNASKNILGRSKDHWFLTNKYASRAEIKLHLEKKNSDFKKFELAKCT